MTVKTHAVVLGGGLDQVSAQLQIKSGRVTDSKNYELLPEGGYRRISGYNRWAGGKPLREDLSGVSIYVVSSFVATGSFFILSGQTSGVTGFALNNGHYINLGNGQFVVAFGEMTESFTGGETVTDNQNNALFVIDSKGLPENVTEEEIITSIRGGYNADEVDITRVKGLTMYKGYVWAVHNNSSDGKDYMQPQRDWDPSWPETGGAAGWQGTANNGPIDPGDYYEFVAYNFKGHSNSEIVFGVNGASKCFYRDHDRGVASPPKFITTGMTEDQPTHIAAFKNHLFLAFRGGSIQHSSINDFSTWSPVTGAGELTAGDEITALKILPGDVLGIFCKDRIFILSGSDAGSWNLSMLSDEVGALPRTIQELPMAILSDTRGITVLQNVQAFGDFSKNMVSHEFDPLYRELIGDIVGSCVNKERSQYRLFDHNGKALYITFNRNNLAGAMLIDLGININCVVSGDDFNGIERTFVGDDDGYVYLLDSGLSFNGNDLEYWLRLPFNHFRSPRQKKRLHHIQLDIDSNAKADIVLRPTFSYGQDSSADHFDAPITINKGKTLLNAKPNVFDFKSTPESTGEVFVRGSGTNIGLTIHGKSKIEAPHTIYGVIYHLSLRGMKR